MATPSIAMNPANIPVVYGMPWAIIRARAQAVSLSADPDMWIVAQSGTVNPATSRSTPMAIVRSSVTGMVAADDWVPSAVKYAGIIDHSSRSGLRVVVENGAATEY